MILDINGTLVDSTHQRRKGIKANIRARHKYVYRRPGLKDFLAFLKANPHIHYAVWSSSIGPNVSPIVKDLFKGMPEPLFVWSRDQCFKLPGPGFRTVKDLALVWRVFPAWGPHNTFLVDDSAEKASRQPNQHIHIPPFVASPSTLASDTALTALRSRLTRECTRSYNQPPRPQNPSSTVSIDQ